MFERALAAPGSTATLHALRHTAAYRMAEDPALPLTDVQFVLGHAQLTTTQIYLTPRKPRMSSGGCWRTTPSQARVRRASLPVPAPGYRPETLEVLFGTGPR